MKHVVIFKEIYGFNTGAGGLAYLGLGVGFVAATLFGAKVAHEIYRKVSVVINILYPFSHECFFFKLADKNGGIGKPEMRIPALCIGSLFVPVGLL